MHNSQNIIYLCEKYSYRIRDIKQSLSEVSYEWVRMQSGMANPFKGKY